MFEQTPANHLSGKGCNKCAAKIRGENRTYTREELIELFNMIHGDKYDYSKVEYNGSKNKVVIKCQEHGEFKQKPYGHLVGTGCPGCAKSGFDRTKKSLLYVLRSDCGRYMKIGITNKPEQRYVQLSRSTPFSFKRIELTEGMGEQMAALEKELLAQYRPVEFDSQFDGYSEWRLWDESIRTKLLTSKIQG